MTTIHVEHDPLEHDHDILYIHDAVISDPYESLHVSWDTSVDPARPVYVVTVPASMDAAAECLAMADELGLHVTGEDWRGDWIAEQIGALH